MLELLVCSMVTILPDYLYRRFAQDKRIGREITIFSVWYELRWGIVACLLLTLSLITMIFYFHPSTSSAASMFRTITILPERGGRVTEVHVGSGDSVEAGQPLFTLDSTEQGAAAASARQRILEVDAAVAVATADVAGAQARIAEAEGASALAVEELERTLQLQQRNPGVVAQREVDRLRNVVASRTGGLDAARAVRSSLETQISALFPAQRASAVAALAEAQVALDKSVIYAGVPGVMEQFMLREGDFVSPILRPAGILVPSDAGRRTVLAGFGQIEAQVLRRGMIAEITCVSKPFVIIPMVVVDIQDLIPAGQIRPTDLLVDSASVGGGGTLTAFLEPLFEGGLEGLPPGSSCIANAYTSNHDRLAAGDLGTFQSIGLHVIDTVGVVHALILRIQALLLPVRTLVLGGGH